MHLNIFLHGLESSGRGTKGLFFRERFPDMLTPDFTGDLLERMKKLNSILEGRSEIILVGSSFGGLMASVFAMENESKVDRLILLAPAINLLGFTEYKPEEIKIPVHIYHGINDDVVPLKSIEEIASKYFKNLLFNRVNDDHVLSRTFRTIDWNSLLN